MSGLRADWAKEIIWGGLKASSLDEPENKRNNENISQDFYNLEKKINFTCKIKFRMHFFHFAIFHKIDKIYTSFISQFLTVNKIGGENIQIPLLFCPKQVLRSHSRITAPQSDLRLCPHHRRENN